MAPKELIINGSFDGGSTGWSGTDLETNYTEQAYLSNGSTNRVAETDGYDNQTTVMEQTFTVDAASDTALTFDTALRNASNPNAGTEGFRVEIVDSSGTVIASQEYFPTANTFNGVSLPVSFPSAGDYTLRITELGPNDGLGAIVDNLSLLVCFANGAKLRTKDGAICVEDIKVGQELWTLDNGYQTVRWVSSRKVSVAQQIVDPSLRPIQFKSDMGADLRVSPQHRMMVSGGHVEKLFATPDVLASAKSLVNGTTVTQASPTQDLVYYHFLFDQHEIVEANGMLSESFFPTELTLGGIDKDASDELLNLFPELENYGQTARMVLRSYEAELIAS